MVKVNNLIRDGVKAHDVKVESANRKQSDDDFKPGVVTVKLKCENDKKKIMKEKKNLKNIAQYKKVFIHNDQKREERLMASDFRMLVNAYKRGDRNIILRGDRIIMGRDYDDNRPEDRFSNQQRHRAGNDKRPRNNASSERSPRETRPSGRDSTHQHGRGGNQRQDKYAGPDRDSGRHDQYAGRFSDRDRDSGRHSYSGRR